MVSFSKATAVRPTSSHTYSAYLPDDWCIGSVLHGGYVTALYLHTATTHFRLTHPSLNQPHPISTQLSFLRRTQTGPALLTVTDLKLGRRTSVIRILLSQPHASSDDPNGPHEEKSLATITQSNIPLETGPTHLCSPTLRPPAPPLPDFTLLTPRAGSSDAHWRFQTAIPEQKFGKATRKLAFYIPRQRTGSDDETRLSTEYWCHFLDPSATFTTPGLGFLADMFPALLEMFRPPKTTRDAATGEMVREDQMWFPTVALNLEVKKAVGENGGEGEEGGEKWLYVRAKAGVVRDGRMNVQVTIMDRNGEVVAVAEQVALMMSASRNLAGRERREKSSKI